MEVLHAHQRGDNHRMFNKPSGILKNLQTVQSQESLLEGAKGLGLGAGSSAADLQPTLAHTASQAMLIGSDAPILTTKND